MTSARRPNAKKRTLIVADPSETFLEQLARELSQSIFARQVELVAALKGKDAQLAVSNERSVLLGAFVNPSLGSPDGISTLRFIRQLRPQLRVVALFESAAAAKIDMSPFKALGVHDFAVKPIGIERILEMLSPPSLLLNPSEALKRSPGDGAQVGAEVSHPDSEYFPIRVEDYPLGTKNLFDVFVRLGKSRHVKVLKAGDTLENGRLKLYLERGLTHFYLKRSDEERYLSYCDQIARGALKRPDIPLPAKLGAILNQGKETVRFLWLHGVSETHLIFAAEFLENSRTLLDSLSSGAPSELALFLKQVSESEHSVTVTLLAGLLQPHLGLRSNRSVQILGTAALLHDIALLPLPREIQALIDSGDLTTLDADQKKLHLTHASLGADLLRKIPRIDESVIQAVGLHHRRRGDGGQGKVLANVSLIAECLAAADELAQLILRIQRDPELELRAELEYRLFPLFSLRIQAAIRKALLGES